MEPENESELGSSPRLPHQKSERVGPDGDGPEWKESGPDDVVTDDDTRPNRRPS